MSLYLDDEAGCSDDEDRDGRLRYSSDEELDDVPTEEDLRFIAEESPEGAEDLSAYRSLAFELEAEGGCSLCMGPVEDRALTNNIKCGHEFCLLCLFHWASVSGGRCPVCNRIFTAIHHERCDQCDEYARDEPQPPSSSSYTSAAGDSAMAVDSKAPADPAAATPAAPAPVSRGWPEGQYGIHQLDLRGRARRAAEYEAELREEEEAQLRLEMMGDGGELSRAALEQEDESCLVCRGDSRDLLAQCSSCGSLCHIYCHDPPLESVPAAGWVCSPCTNGRQKLARLLRLGSSSRPASRANTQRPASAAAANSASSSSSAATAANGASPAAARKPSAMSDAKRQQPAVSISRLLFMLSAMRGQPGATAANTASATSIPSAPTPSAAQPAKSRLLESRWLQRLARVAAAQSQPTPQTKPSSAVSGTAQPTQDAATATAANTTSAGPPPTAAASASDAAAPLTASDFARTARQARSKQLQAERKRKVQLTVRRRQGKLTPEDLRYEQEQRRARIVRRMASLEALMDRILTRQKKRLMARLVAENPRAPRLATKAEFDRQGGISLSLGPEEGSSGGGPAVKPLRKAARETKQQQQAARRMDDALADALSGADPLGRLRAPTAAAAGASKGSPIVVDTSGGLPQATPAAGSTANGPAAGRMEDVYPSAANNIQQPSAAMNGSGLNGSPSATAGPHSDTGASGPMQPAAEGGDLPVIASFPPAPAAAGSPERRTKRPRSRGSRSFGEDRSRKRHKPRKAADTSSAAETQQSAGFLYIKENLGKMFDALPGSQAQASQRESIVMKLASKVFDDWQSKPRDGVDLTRWFSEQGRTQKISASLSKYVERQHR